MDTSRRAVESYWRSRMIDGATSDEDKVTPVYKLEEICELLRSSHVSIVKEVSDFILKRLDHKSPIVKQKALRLIKYGVGKSGVEFRREMQRHSVAVRQLLHYKGQPDPLKGDALNKSVRETAQEAISAIFAGEESKPAPSEDLNRRIEGFGNTNYEISSASSSSDDRKSFFSEVVGIGSASIKQGLSHIAAAHSLKKNDNGSYRSPNLRRSLTTERDHDRYGSAERQNDSRSSLSSGISTNAATGTWGQETRVNTSETTNGISGSGYSVGKTREERLLETIVTSGGVRLQPTRDALQVFHAEALKLDAVALSHALESKLQSHLWQVRMKAVCVLESIIRKKDDEHFAIVASYFSENRDSVVQCSESPQASLREKATKVLNILDEDHQDTGSRNYSENESREKVGTAAVQMPDLLDTSGPDDFYGNEDFTQTQNDDLAHMASATAPITDLFGDSLITGLSTTEQKNEDDPFADVSFHTNEEKEQADDLFSGLTVDKKDNTTNNDIFTSANNGRPELVDIFSSSSESFLHEPTVGNDMNDLMAGLNVNGSAPEMKQQGNNFSDLGTQQNQPISNDALNGMFGSQMNVNPNATFPLGTMPYNMPPNMMFNPAFASQQMNYGVMGSFLAQQQLLATMSNFQQLGSFNALGGNANLGHLPGNSQEGGYSSALPDIFNPALPAQNHGAILNNPKKEETKAFDFISDHLSAARDPKRVV